MSSINNNKNNKKVNKKNQKNDFFNLDIKDDIFDPFKDDLFNFDSFENKMFKNIFNIFDAKKETEKPKEVEAPKEVKPEEKMEEEKEEEINTNTKEVEKEEEINTNTKKEEMKPKEENKGTIYSKVYRYNNINGKEERYTSQSIKQINDEHNISEIKEIYNNSDGICKSAYQRGLDDKTTRFIKEKNIKTGKKDEHKIIKGIEENEIKDFNKEYDEFSKKFGFRKSLHDLNAFNPFGFKKQINYNPNLLRLLF
jgi:hypothetical protein